MLQHEARSIEDAISVHAVRFAFIMLLLPPQKTIQEVEETKTPLPP